MRDQQPRRFERDFRSGPKLTVRKPLKPAKPKGWSHQDELTPGATILVHFNQEASPIEGVIETADQFTIKIKRPHTISSVIFKSAIREFSVRRA